MKIKIKQLAILTFISISAITITGTLSGCSKSKVASIAAKKVAKEEAKEITEKSTKELVEEAAKTSVKKTGKDAAANRYAKTAIRREAEKAMKEKGVKSYAQHVKKGSDQLADHASISASKTSKTKSLRDAKTKKNGTKTTTTSAKIVKTVTGQEGLALLKKKGPKGIGAIIEKLNKKGLPLSDLIVKEMEDGSLSVVYKTAEYGPITSMVIKKNKIIAKAGSLKGKVGAQNQFLNNILPNMTYEVDGCFFYKTDKLGRVVEATVDRSKLKKAMIDRGERNSDTQRLVVGNAKGMDGGHLFPKEIGGPNEAINQVPMAPSLNRNGGKWRAMEKKEDAITDASSENVIIIRKIVYKGDSRVPAKFQNEIRVGGKKYEIPEYPSTLVNPSAE